MAAKRTDPGMAMEQRHVYGPRPIGALVPALTRPSFRRRSPAVAQVLADWSAIVGPAIAAVTTPHRMSSGTLTIACGGPIAMELQHLATEVIGRINSHLGQQAVTALRFMQITAPAVPVAPPAPPVHSHAVDAAVAGLPQGELRDALAALGRAVLARKLPPRSLD